MHVKSIFNRKYKEEAKKFLKKNVDDLKRNNPSKAYATIKKLGASVGEENNKSSFSIQSHVEEELNPLEPVERIASHFSSISQEYPAVSIDRVNEEVRSNINSAKSSDVPYISRLQVEKILRKTKKNS